MAFTAFLDTYYNQLDDNLNDPSITKRITKAKKLELLTQIEATIWERLLTITGQESLLGYTEVDMTISNDTDEYALPGNFRQFLKFEKRKNGDRDDIQGHLSSVPYYSNDMGVVINSQLRGMRIQPVPDLSADETWTLSYMKGPVQHFSTTGTWVTGTTFDLSTPSAGYGQVIGNDDYYNGSILRVTDSGSATPASSYDLQVREVTDFDGSNSRVTMTAWSPAWTAGTITVETATALPEGLNAIYALDAAIHILGRRGKAAHRRALIQERAELWNACKNFYLSNVADRGPGRVLPHDPHEPDDGNEDHYSW